jgi:hypothetical protein
MPFYRKRNRMILASADVSEECMAPIIRVKRINKPGTLAATSYSVITGSVAPSSLILSALIMEALSSSETSVLIRSKRYHISDYGILLNKNDRSG